MVLGINPLFHGKIKCCFSSTIFQRNIASNLLAQKSIFWLKRFTFWHNISIFWRTKSIFGVNDFGAKKVEIDNAKVIFLLELVVIINEWLQSFLTEKLPYCQMCGTKVRPS